MWPLFLTVFACTMKHSAATDSWGASSCSRSASDNRSITAAKKCPLTRARTRRDSRSRVLNAGNSMRWRTSSSMATLMRSSPVVACGVVRRPFVQSFATSFLIASGADAPHTRSARCCSRS